MKLVTTSSRFAIILSCTALLGSLHAQDAADKPSGEAAPAPKAAKPIELPETVATVNGEKISKEELQKAFDNAVKMSGMDAAALTPDQKLAGYHKLLDDIITEKLLKAKAADIKVTDAEVDEQIADIKKNFPDDKAFEAQMKEAGIDDAKLREQIKDGLAQTNWIKSQIGDKADVTPADAEKFYKENEEQFKIADDQVRASHILFATKDAEGNDLPADKTKEKEAAAAAAYKKIKDGADFAKLADELTEDPSGKGRGGDLNYFPKGQMVPEFDKEVFSMKVGDVSEPVKTQFGYHVIKVTDQRKAGTMIPLDDELKSQLTGFLKSQKQQTAVRDVVEKVRTEAKVVNNLPEMKAPEEAAAPAANPGAAAAEPKGSE